jgi:hypothetical protein
MEALHKNDYDDGYRQNAFDAPDTPENHMTTQLSHTLPFIFSVGLQYF